MKKILIIAAIAFGIWIGFIQTQPSASLRKQERKGFSLASSETVIATPREPKLNKSLSSKNTFLPKPLSLPFKEINTYLDPKLILSWTNQHRAIDNLDPLILNSTLNEIAQAKVSDMFEKNYFAHISPSGVGPSDLAEDFDYSFIMVGENLAKGNFETSKKLVQAWMDSPGHRDNIMRPGYREIGLAVGQTKEGDKEVWLAVQTFGTPSTLCPQPEGRGELLLEKQALDNAVDELKVLKEEIDTYIENSENTGQLQALVEEYNILAVDYNAQMQEFNYWAREFEQAVKEFNECILDFR